MFMLNSYEFEVAAKNAMIDLLSDRVKLEIGDIDVNKFALVMGNKTCDLYSWKMPGYFVRASFSEESGNMYVEVYKKLSSDTFEFKDINVKVKASDTSKKVVEKKVDAYEKL